MKNENEYKVGDKVIILGRGKPSATGKVDYVGRDITVQIDDGVREVFERDELQKCD